MIPSSMVDFRTEHPFCVLSHSHVHFIVMFPSLAMFIALIKREWQIMPHRVVPILNILMIFVPLMHTNGSDMKYILKMSLGALDGGSPMSHVEFKKWICQLSLFF